MSTLAAQRAGDAPATEGGALDADFTFSRLMICCAVGARAKHDPKRFSMTSEQTSIRYIAGIGASAGGIEALERFFRCIPEDLGIAFIVVQHLSAEHKSLMAEILVRFTRLPVTDAQDGEEIVANHVYLLPPGKEVEVHGNRLAVSSRGADRALHFPIDRLLNSLAESHGGGAIAVILSGTGSDGSRGVRRIDEMGGLVLVEDPTAATFDGMPKAAIDTGTASAVLGAESLALVVAEHVQDGALPRADDLRHLESILALLHERLGSNFIDYKRGTMYRRTLRRARQSGSPELAEYRLRLERDHAELQALHDDLFIGVTSFFRDPETFNRLTDEINALVQNKIESQRELRIWCAGCATGEEAYSLAILFDEAVRATGIERTFKLFATDLQPAALQAASDGVYAARSLASLSPDRLRCYFRQRADGTYQVEPSLRNRIVFARHDVLRDTPFTNLDVVSCRNLLIYLKVTAQRHALASLTYGLRIGGLLVLGSSETPGELSSAMDVVHEGAKLFRKRFHTRAMQRPLNGRTGVPRSGTSETSRPESRLLPIYDALIETVMPPAFLISSQRALLDSYAGAARLLEVPARRPSGDFFEMVPASARPILLGLFVRAQREPGPARAAGVRWLASQVEQSFTVSVQRLNVSRGEPAFIISLTVEGAAKPAATESSIDPGVVEAALLQQELSHARATLQATVEELEASNEELQATNEEMMASNEELQSVNEELHSVNEELHTVNAEHQRKISELTELNRDIGHLLESIDVATIYLDRELRIRKYTPRAGVLFGLVEHDVGRYLASFNHQLHYPLLMADVTRVRDSKVRIESEVRGRDERWYFVRILPYRVDSAIEGAVVTITDSTALAAAKERARELSSIVESSADAIIGMDTQGKILSWNAAATRIYGYTAEEAVGQSIMMLIPGSEAEDMRKLLAQIGSGADLVNVATSRISKSGAVLQIAKTISPVRDAQGVMIGIATIDRDIHEQKELERRLRDSEHRYEDLYNNAPDMYLSIDLRAGRVLEFNQTFLRVTGYTAEQVKDVGVLDLFPEPFHEATSQFLRQLRDGRAVNDLPLQIRRAGRDDLDVTLSASAVFAADGTVVGSRTVLRDVSTRKLAERKLQEAAQMRERFLAMVSHELRGPLHAINTALQIIDRPEASDELRARSQSVLRRQTRQMTRLVDDLLDVSRITHDKLHLERAPLALGSVARSALDAVAPSYHEKGVRLVSEGLDLAMPMFGDAGRLAQVFANLLTNALRYTPEGRQVHVSCRRVGNSCEVEICDQGRGIAAEDIKNIFDLFAQARQGLARSDGGLGLGLTIAERIVTAHGGTIKVFSEGPGHGATFTVTLPLDVQAAPTRPSPATSSRKLFMAVVEDQDDNREMMMALLEMSGHEVAAAADGESGLAMILEKRPRVAILDIGLPRMNGYEVAREVRKQLGATISLIAMSGYGQPEDVREAQAAGFDIHLTKPLDQRRLTAALRDLVSEDAEVV